MKSLILSVAMSAVFFSTSAKADVSTLALTTPINVKPTAEQAVCLKREYNEDHLRAYPKQKLSAMYIIVKVAKVDTGDDKTLPAETYTSAEVIGQKSTGDKSFYANWDSACEFGTRGTAHCFVECDGGSFDLLPRPVDVLFRVSKDYFFPLYKPGSTRDNATSAETITLDAKDMHNAVYRLYQAPIRECIEARKQAKKINSDC